MKIYKLEKMTDTLLFNSSNGKIPFPVVVNNDTVCLLSKLSEAKHHISVQFDMAALDLIAAESKATHEEIQDWVQKSMDSM